VAGPAIAFPHACTRATPSGIRAHLCPDPWSLLHYRRPRIHAQTAYTQRISSSPDLHRIDWQSSSCPRWDERFAAAREPLGNRVLRATSVRPAPSGLEARRLSTRSITNPRFAQLCDGEHEQRDAAAEECAGNAVREPVDLQVRATPGNADNTEAGERPPPSAASVGCGEEQHERDTGRAGVGGLARGEGGRPRRASCAPSLSGSSTRCRPLPPPRVSHQTPPSWTQERHGPYMRAKTHDQSSTSASSAASTQRVTTSPRS
jgi:hypothetical protein